MFLIRVFVQVKVVAQVLIQVPILLIKLELMRFPQQDLLPMLILQPLASQLAVPHRDGMLSSRYKSTYKCPLDPKVNCVTLIAGFLPSPSQIPSCTLVEYLFFSILQNRDGLLPHRLLIFCQVKRPKDPSAIL